MLRQFIATVFAICLGTQAVLAAGSVGGWAYDGPYGPQNWHHISEDFAACGEGAQQSPVDLTEGVAADLAPLQLRWKPAAWSVQNSGHGMMAQSKDAGSMVLDDTPYRLMQFHFHSPSEHTMNGETFPMEAHFVHVAEDNRIAVLAVMFVGGGRNPAFEAVLARVPGQTGDPQSLNGFDPTRLVSDLTRMSRYEGSLTTPPCSETVSWIILSTPVVVSDAAITAFGILFGGNARPVQPLNRRYVLTSGP